MVGNNPAPRGPTVVVFQVNECGIVLVILDKEGMVVRVCYMSKFFHVWGFATMTVAVVKVLAEEGHVGRPEVSEGGVGPTFLPGGH